MNTQDLSKFGLRELAEAGRLLSALKTANDQSVLGDGICVEFNPNSGNVFLVDSEFNVAMMTDKGTLENWYNCPECGHEGFADDMGHEGGEDCQDFVKSLIAAGR